MAGMSGADPAPLRCGGHRQREPCTWRASACTCSSGVVGRMPWPRLKMCPGRPAARRRTSSAAASRRSSGPSSSVGSRLPWMPRSWPMRVHASSSGSRQSTPITSPPASREVGEDRRRADAEVDQPARRASRSAVEDARRCAAARTRGSPRGRARPPTSRTPAAPATPASTCARGSRPSSSAKRSQSRCHAAGCAYMNALVCAKVVEGPPSIAYDASVNGAPPKPISGTGPASSPRSSRIVSSTCASASRGSNVAQPVDVGRACESAARSPALRP